MTGPQDKKNNMVYDLIGVGLGPFNLSLAALAKPIAQLNTAFFEQNENFNWHPGLMLENTHLQVPFLADLVTLADPTSPFSFLNYLQQHGRLYKFYFHENFHISRKEYNHYCQWVAAQIPNIYYKHRVTQVERYHQNEQSLLRVTVNDLNKDTEYSFDTKHLAIGIGTAPYIPEKLKKFNSDYIQHSAHFLDFNSHIKSEKSVVIVGSGQSAAEVVLDLLNQHDQHPRQLTWVTQSRGFFPMEYSKLGLEHFSPDYMNYFYNLEDETKKQLIPQQDLLYKGISQKTIAEIFDKIYELTVANQPQPLTLLAHSELEDVHYTSSDSKNRFRLDFRQWQQQQNFCLESDAIILATGYQAPQPTFMNDLEDILITDNKQAYALNQDFSIMTKQPIENKIFIQNNSLFSHGIGSPDLGLGCYRNSTILNNITKKLCYPLNETNVFQTFSRWSIV